MPTAFPPCPRGGAAIGHALSVPSSEATRLGLSIGCGKRDTLVATNDGCKWPTSTYIGARPSIYLAGIAGSESVFSSFTLTP